MPSDPSSADGAAEASGTSAAESASASPGGPGGSSRKSALGEKNSVPVIAVEKSRIRSVLPGGLPMNMFTSISSVTEGVLA